ncbi:MAG: hypothetical protein PW791_13955 [Neorhizobium sp.]|nr:hypothetical protein [Neorhizobium sp.]
MAQIVTLNAWRSSHQPKAPSIEIGKQHPPERPFGPADVLIFTGVRYERFDDRMDRKAENHTVRLEQN